MSFRMMPSLFAFFVRFHLTKIVFEDLFAVFFVRVESFHLEDP